MPTYFIAADPSITNPWYKALQGCRVVWSEGERRSLEAGTRFNDEVEDMLGYLMEARRRRYVRKLVERGLTLGRDVELNDGFFLDPSHCFLITIEDGVTFGPGVKLFAHDASCKKSLGKTRIGLVRLHRNCFIGASSVILPGVTVGENSIIGANSTVSSSVPANQVWAGSPATKVMSLADHVKMLSMRRGNDFPEESYRIDRLTKARRDEMIEVLKRDRVGFMVP